MDKHKEQYKWKRSAGYYWLNINGLTLQFKKILKTRVYIGQAGYNDIIENRLSKMKIKMLEKNQRKISLLKETLRNVLGINQSIIKSIEALKLKVDFMQTKIDGYENQIKKLTERGKS